MDKQYLIMKRDLFYRPDSCGYTGIRDHAGRFSYEEAKKIEHPEGGVTMIRLEDAPEFSKACFHDLALNHAIKQRDALVEAAKPIVEHLTRWEEDSAAVVPPIELSDDQAAFIRVGQVRALRSALLKAKGEGK